MALVVTLIIAILIILFTVNLYGKGVKSFFEQTNSCEATGISQCLSIGSCSDVSGTVMRDKNCPDNDETQIVCCVTNKKTVQEETGLTKASLETTNGEAIIANGNADNPDYTMEIGKINTFLAAVDGDNVNLCEWTILYDEVRKPADASTRIIRGNRKQFDCESGTRESITFTPTLEDFKYQPIEIDIVVFPPYVETKADLDVGYSSLPSQKYHIRIIGNQEQCVSIDNCNDYFALGEDYCNINPCSVGFCTWSEEQCV